MPLDNCLILRVLLLQGENNIALLLHDAESLLRNLVRIRKALIALVNQSSLLCNCRILLGDQLLICCDSLVPLID